MPILTRYLIKETLKIMLAILIMVIAIYVFIDFIEKSGKFVQAGLPISRTITFFIYNIPLIISQIFPVVILLSVLIVLGIMNKRNEILALKSCGVSIYLLLKPLLTMGLIMAGALFFLSNSVVPMSSRMSNQIWMEEVRGKKANLTGSEQNIWINGNNRITHIGFYDPVQKVIKDITLYIFDDNFKLIRRLDAAGGSFSANGWNLTDILDQRLEYGKNHYTTTHAESKTVNLDFSVDDLARVAVKSEELNFQSLWKYIQKVESEGYDATLYRVDLHAKLAMPFVCVIMPLLGIGIALRGNRNEGVAVGVAYGIGASFLYWILMSFCMSLGYGDMLPPFVAAWIANFIFITLGGILLINAE
ncbi:MAG: LPS export ABC transporter permease LptG [Desulfobacteraceae bacterium]|jgi:lipopolysaccharide export system permease protein